MCVCDGGSLGWVHGDVSAENVVLVRTHAPCVPGAMPSPVTAWKPVLIDFDLAHRPCGDSAAARTPPRRKWTAVEVRCSAHVSLACCCSCRVGERGVCECVPSTLALSRGLCCNSVVAAPVRATVSLCLLLWLCPFHPHRR